MNAPKSYRILLADDHAGAERKMKAYLATTDALIGR